MQRIAAIDAGSNALRLVVASLDDAWHMEPVESIRIPVRLGEDVFSNNILREQTIQQAVDAFNQFRNIINDFGVSRVRAVATSAVREAQNNEVLVDRIYRASGIELEVISGEEEARLVHLAVTNALDLAEKRAMVVDIGGGSVEIMITENGSIRSVSTHNLGTVRLLQRLDEETHSGESGSFTLLLREYTDAARRRIEKEVGNGDLQICIATGGNVEEIGELRRKLFKRDSDRLVTVKELDELVTLLGGMSVKERMETYDLRPDRADVILPAAIVLKMIAGIAGVDEVHIPHVGLKNGILLDLAQNMAEQMHLPNRHQVWDSAVRIGKKYQFRQEHASYVSRLASRLFDQAVDLHQLDGEERLILEIGSLLHDIGHYINTVDHDQHGYYLLKANHILGLSERQQEMVACLVQFHRRGVPYSDKTYMSDLSKKDRLTVAKLCAFLRLSDALDASHTQRVKDAILTRSDSTWHLCLVGEEDLTLEKWSVLKRRELFQEIFGSILELDDEPIG